MLGARCRNVGRSPRVHQHAAGPASIELRASLRYTGTRLRLGDRAFRSGRAHHPCRPGILSPIYQRLNDVLYIEQIANIIAETCDIPRDTNHPREPRDRRSGHRQPRFFSISHSPSTRRSNSRCRSKKWTQEVKRRQGHDRTVFRPENLADRIDELVAAKNTGA